MTSGSALPNVGPGPDPLSLSELDAAFAVLLLHRDFYCSECRQQVRRVKSRYEEFEQRDAEVLSVLPEDPETTEEWQKQYHLPFPVIADAEKELGKRFDQPTRYGLLGKLHDIIGRMPATIVVDLRWSDPTETFAHRGNSKTDRPRVDELLAAIDNAAAMGPESASADSTQADGSAESTSASPGLEASTTGGQVTRPDAGGAPETDAPPEAGPPPETAGAVEPDEQPETAEQPEAMEQGETAEQLEPTEQPEADEAVEPGAETDAEAAGDGGSAEAQPESSPTEIPLYIPDRVDLPEAIELRRAGEEDAMPVIRVLQGSLLEIDSSTVRQAVARGDVIVAESDGWVIGALVLEDNHVDALAVRREYRKQGLGSALVETAATDLGGPVTADFRAGVRGFWQNLDFDIEKEGDRFYGIRSG